MEYIPKDENDIDYGSYRKRARVASLARCLMTSTDLDSSNTSFFEAIKRMTGGKYWPRIDPLIKDSAERAYALAVQIVNQ